MGIAKKILCAFVACALVVFAAHHAAAETIKISLNEAVSLALKSHRSRLVSRAAVDIAEAQHQQARSALWPRLGLSLTASRMDENPNFIFPASSLSLGPAAAPLAEAIANAQLAKAGIGPGTPGYNVMLANAAAQVLPGLQNFSIPSQDVTIMNRDSLVATLTMSYPLYTGGKISSVIRQAKLGTEAAKEAFRKTDLQVIHDVRRLYYGSLLAGSLYQIGKDTLERFEVTLELTEKLYKTGSGRVKKTDYLRTQVVVSSLRSLLMLMKSNLELSRSALANAMGLEWQSSVLPSEGEIPFSPYGHELAQLVAETQQSNPLAAQVTIGLDASGAKIDEAKSGYLPVIALFGNLNHIENSLNSGLMTDKNRNSWLLGIRMELPLFEGFRTEQGLKEAQARLEKLKQEELLLKEGLALQVKDAFLQIARAQGQVTTMRDALGFARENRELNTMAYQEELVETKDVIEAQLIEFFINGQFLQALYDNQVSQADLEQLVARRILEETRQ